MANRTPTKRKPVKRTPVARVTEPDPSPGQTGGGWEEARYEAALWSFGLLQSYKDDVHVNDYTALTYGVVYRCLVYLSQTIATFGWHQFESVPGKPGKERIYDDVSWLLDTQASPEMSAFEWRQVMLLTAASRGNSYSEIERDGYGRPRWKWYIAEDRVCLERDDAGNLYYKVDNGVGEKPSIIRPENMFHLRAPGPDGLVGYSVIGLARASIRLGLQTEKYGDTYFRRGPMPGGILELPGPVKKEERDSMRKSFEDAYGGAKNAGRVVVTSGGVKFNPLSLPNEDAQFIESRKFQVNEICRWFGVPPHKVFDLERATFSNIEHQSIEVVQDCILPWCRRLETEADIKLFGRIMRGRRYVRLNLNTLLRGDSATQTANLVSQVNTGLVTPDEAREHLDYNPYPDGLGEEPIVQGAMMTLETALDPPEPPQPPPNPAQPDGEPPQPAPKPAQAALMPTQIQATFGALLADKYSVLLRVEIDKAQRAKNKDFLMNHIVVYYVEDSCQRIAEAIRPTLEGLLLVLGRPADRADQFARQFAENHNARSVRELCSGEWAQAWANGRADEQAREHLQTLWESLL